MRPADSRSPLIAVIAASIAGSLVLAGTASAIDRPNARAQAAAAAVNVLVTGPTRLLAGGDVIILDNQGRGHRLRGTAGLLSQLRVLAGKRMTVDGTAVADPAREPNYPIRVRDFRIEPGGAFNGQQVAVTGATRRLSDGDVIVIDTFGRGHRLRGLSAAVRTEIANLAGRRVTVEGVATITNAAARLNWPINVTRVTAAP